ncbi:Cys-tRNA(Pro) deacylase [Candidatus Colwellia aromaticivorans]|uniref:Cys-tRNA(Pro) deacylase n=1 Tax=Candidatus Colwellia aromaticivorans TaxID=2267621 RepID=UPI000DF25EC9|nr:Cys-tRNA(Pro) deacylase [Candidatus Colwellia aromaticivorans]
MTPAIKQLKQKNISFKIHQYQHDANAQSFGIEAVEKLSLNAEQVFKTLVICTDTNQLAVAIVPVMFKLNLKAIAKTLKVKKVKMADANRVEVSTGYVLGGVSPLGQKKLLTTIIDNSAQHFTYVFVSGGKRGLEIELSPQDLATMCRAIFADIVV